MDTDTCEMNTWVNENRDCTGNCRCLRWKQIAAIRMMVPESTSKGKVKQSKQLAKHGKHGKMVVADSLFRCLCSMFLLIFNLNCQPKHRNWKRCMMACLPRPWSDLSSARQSTQSRCLGLRHEKSRAGARLQLPSVLADFYLLRKIKKASDHCKSAAICPTLKVLIRSATTWEVFQDLSLLRTEPSKCHAPCCRR